jgi:hypothetical protein
MHASKEERWVEHSLSGRWSLVDPETGEGEDTAMGLPHPKHNPNCEIEKNPTFALRVRRPCDVRVVLTQRDGSGVAPAELQPVSIYVVLPAETDKAGKVIPGSGGSGIGTSANRPQRVFALNRRNVSRREKEVNGRDRETERQIFAWLSETIYYEALLFVCLFVCLFVWLVGWLVASLLAM